MPSTENGSSSKSIPSHEWTAEETYNLLDQILDNPKCTQNFFPTPGHTPAPGTLERYVRSLCSKVLTETKWMERMKKRSTNGRLDLGKRWNGDDPVSIRLKQLPVIAKHYEERLGGYRRYEDIPPGSEFTKRWRKYEKCPERKWVLKYITLKSVQAVNSMMVSADCIEDLSTTTAVVNDSERNSKASGSKKRPSKSPTKRPDQSTSNSKRPRLSAPAIISHTPTCETSSTLPNSRLNRKSLNDRGIDIICISDSDSDSDSDDDTPISLIHKPRKERIVSTNTTIIDSSSENDSDSDEIRLVSPPIITLPSRSFAQSPIQSPIIGTIPSPIRLAFQKPMDDIPTDSEDEEENTPLPAINTFSSISLTTDQDLVGMFTDHNLRPQQAWRMKLPTPPDSRASGSTSPVKRGQGLERDGTPDPEVAQDVDMVLDTNLEDFGESEVSGNKMGFDINSEEDDFPDRPLTPPLPPTLSRSVNVSAPEARLPVTTRNHERSSTPPSRTMTPVDDHPVNPPLPDHLRNQDPSNPDMGHDDEVIGLQSDAERDIARRLLESLTSDHQVNHLDTGQEHHVVSHAHIEPREVKAEIETSALADWIDGHVGQPVGSRIPAEGHAKRSLVERMSLGHLPDKGIGKGQGKGKEVERQASDTTSNLSNQSGQSSRIASTSIASTSTPTCSSEAQSLSLRLSSGATAAHQATFQVASSILDLLIAQTFLSPQTLVGHSIAFTSGHIPFKPKLTELIIALGGVVVDVSHLRYMVGSKYVVHPIGYSRVGEINGIEHVDVLGLLKIIGLRMRGLA